MMIQLQRSAYFRSLAAAFFAGAVCTAVWPSFHSEPLQTDTQHGLKDRENMLNSLKMIVAQAQQFQDTTLMPNAEKDPEKFALYQDILQKYGEIEDLFSTGLIHGMSPFKIDQAYQIIVTLNLDLEKYNTPAATPSPAY